MDGVEAECLEEIARALVEGLSKRVLQFPSAYPHGQAYIGNGHAFEEVVAQPLLGSSSETGPVSRALSIAGGFGPFLGSLAFPPEGNQVGNQLTGGNGSQRFTIGRGAVQQLASKRQQAGLEVVEASPGQQSHRPESAEIASARIRLRRSQLPAALPDRGWHVSRDPQEAGHDATIDGFAGRGEHEQAPARAPAIPPRRRLVPHQGDRTPAGGRGADDAGVDLGVVEVERPFRGLKLLDPGDAFGAAEKIRPQFGAGHGFTELVRITEIVRQVPEPARRGRGLWLRTHGSNSAQIG